nr:hypothetical protein [Tissierella sp.]
MNKVLLINRINTKDFQEDMKRIFFLIGDLQKNDTENYLMDTLNEVDFLRKENIVYKYNGVEISMQEENIPKIIKKLVEADIDIYSIYELYDPLV